ncbi:MAG: hypothetical protein DHS20C05_23190 [Hyphococcus sp.]|nr:MAG: hypothetical protein DHS20C05_23190 [Marinicaulis sp.]
MPSSFRNMTACAPLALLLTSAIIAPAYAQQQAVIPDIAQALLDAAYASDDPSEIAAVVKAVNAVFPDYEAAIIAQSDARIATLAPEEAEEETAVAETKKVTKDAADEGGYFALKPWDGKIQAGASLASGNSDNVSVGFALDAARTAGAWVHNVTAYVDYAESNNITNQDRWGAAYQLDYKFNERTYAYGRFSYDQDSFSGFDYRIFGGAGLGHFLYKSEPFSWKLEGGPGYRYSPLAMSDAIEEQFALYASTELDWLIREGVKFEQDFNTTWTSPTTTFQSITALTAAVTDSISTGLSFEYRYETDPPLGRENSDTIARATLVYGF